MAAGRSMGAFMIVEIGFDRETREGIAGPPVTDVSGNIIGGGIKMIQYRVTLQVFHLAETAYAEDAQDDVDQLVEAIKQQIRKDRKLGGVCTQAGEGGFGIQTSVGKPGVDKNNRTGTWFQVQFEVMTQFVA